MIDQTELKNILRYEPETGKFIWIYSLHRTRIGTEAGSYMRDGYKRIKIGNKGYVASRLAWLYMTGEWPKHDIDHKDTDKKNDKWENLREATDAEQARNRNVKRNNVSGYKGVRQATSGRYEAAIKLNGKYKYLGMYDTPEEAADAYADAAVEAYDEFARFT
jgi:hypothetical protein